MDQKRIDWFIIVQYLLCILTVLFTVLGHERLTSMTFSLTFAVLFARILVFINKKTPSKYFLLTLAPVYLALICILISSLQWGQRVSFDYLRAYMIFSATIWMSYLAVSIPMNRNTAWTILFSNLVIASIYPLALRFQPGLMPEEETLALNFSNPNLTGMYVALAIIYAVLATLLFRHWLLKLLCLFAAVLNGYLLYFTQARNAWFSILFFVVLLVYFAIFGTSIRHRIVNLIMNISPLLFIPIYYKILQNTSIRGFFEVLEDDGKPLESRVAIWSSVFDKLRHHWLFGVYPIGNGNVHNSFLVVLSSFGAITLIAVIALYIVFTGDLLKQSTNRKSLYCVAAFFASVTMGFGEGAFFSGGLVFYILSCGFLLLARYHYRKEK